MFDCILILNKYKTESTYGQKIIDCLIKIYHQIIYLNYENNTNIFYKTNWDSSFCKFISSIFCKNPNGRHLTMKLIINSYIYYDYKNEDLKYINEHTKTALQMAQSENQHGKYVKILHRKANPLTVSFANASTSRSNTFS